MKHKMSAVAVIISLLTLVLVFTACGGGGNVASEGTIKPRTITIYSITGDSTTQEAIKAVEDSLNDITESLYKTHVVLKLYKESEYEDVLKEVIAANERGDVGVDLDDSDDVEVTEYNEYGRPLTVYPQAVKNQFDIFLIPEGYESFDYYTQEYFNFTDTDGTLVEMGGVALDISSELSSSSNGFLLNQYIPSKVLDFCRENPVDSSSALYGIPSNRYYGDAEYMLINKELFAEYNYDPSTITDMFSVHDFLEDLAADCGSGKRENTVPLYNVPSMNLVSLTGKKSVVAQAVSPDSLVSSGMYTPMNIFAIPSVQQTMRFVSDINVAGGIMPIVTDNVDFDTEFGAAFVYGNASTLEQYADDYYVLLNTPSLVENEDIYKGIYAISNYASEYADRCMQILTCLNTNAEFRNIFGYGVENMNYIIDEETGYVVKTNDTYEMDLEATGNMFLLMQNSEMSEEELILSAESWAVAKATNNDAVVSPYNKFTLSTEYVASDYSNLLLYQPTAVVIPELEMLYDEIWVWIAEFPTYSSPTTGEKLNTFSEYLIVLQEELNKNLSVQSASSQVYTTSLRMQYTTWYNLMYGGAPS